MLPAAVVAGCFGNSAAHAEASEKALEFGLAPRFVQVRDDTLRPVRWVGGQLALQGGVEIDGPEAKHLADLELAAGLVKNRFGHSGVPVGWGAHYAYLHSAHHGRGVELMAGGAYRWETFAGYYADWDDSFLYWLTAHTLAPAVAFRSDFSKSRQLFVLVEIPMVGVMSRSEPYRDNKVDPLTYPSRWIAHTHQDLRGAGPANLYAPSLSARYQSMVSARWGMLYSLTLAYRRTPRPRTFTLLTQTLAVEVRHVF